MVLLGRKILGFGRRILGFWERVGGLKEKDLEEEEEEAKDKGVIFEM